MGLTEADFWAAIDDYEFWSGLDPTPEARAIVELALEHLPVEGIWVLTSASQGEDCKRGKRDWMARHFPQFAERIIYSRTKGDFADRASILLDDGQQNVDAFRAAGGIAWLVPRPWNDDHEREPFLSEDLAAFLAETLPALRCRAA
jgi:5'(3')-deoxyribonucleotidase